MGMTKRLLNWGAVGLVVASAACAPATSLGTGTTASGSLALSMDDALLYAVDTDNSILAVIDTKSEAKIAQVKVGVRPFRVAVAPDDTIFVANRGSRSVSVIRRGDWEEAAQIPTGVDPVGLVVSPDGKTLYVVSATSSDTTDYGTLLAVDTQTLSRRWELPVGEEPRGIALVGNGARAVVSLFRQGDVVEVDLAKGTVIRGSTDTYQRTNAARLSSSSSVSSARGASSFRARALADVVASPDGQRVFVPTVWAREEKILTSPTPGVGYYSSGGPCSLAAVVSAGILTFDTRAELSPRVDDITACPTSGGGTVAADFPPTALSSASAGFTTTSSGGSATNTMPMQGPSVAAVDPTGTWLFVVNKETSNVAVMPANNRNDAPSDTSNSEVVLRPAFGRVNSIRSLVRVGAGADGIAIRKDGSRAYVYSQFDHRVDVLVADGSGASASVAASPNPIVVAQDVLPAELASGRRFFHDALDARMSGGTTNVACSTCHLEGRDDGHTWGFPDGQRRTPTLAGRALLSTAPFHWSGEFPEMAGFMDHTIKARMAGKGPGQRIVDQIAAFIDSMPAPENPFHNPTGDAQKATLVRGRAAFEKAQCDTCHAGAVFTHNGFSNVGTLKTKGANADNGLVLKAGFNVPSLLSLARSGPYLHDGSAPSLLDRVLNNPGDQHGVTSGLSTDERADLVAYLKSL